MPNGRGDFTDFEFYSAFTCLSKTFLLSWFNSVSFFSIIANYSKRSFAEVSFSSKVERRIFASCSLLMCLGLYFLRMLTVYRQKVGLVFFFFNYEPSASLILEFSTSATLAC